MESEPEPEPATVEPTPEPATVEPTPEPAIVEPTPEPAIVEPKPEPATMEPKPEPATMKPQPESEPEPEPDPESTEVVRERAISEDVSDSGSIAEEAQETPIVVESEKESHPDESEKEAPTGESEIALPVDDAGSGSSKSDGLDETSREGSDTGSRLSRGSQGSSISTIGSVSSLMNTSPDNSMQSDAGSQGTPVPLLYGGCDGSDSYYVRIVSADEHLFIVARHLVMMAGTLRAMILADIENPIMQFIEIPSHLMSMIFIYLGYKAYYEKQEPQEEFDFDVEPHLALPLLMAASFLNC